MFKTYGTNAISEKLSFTLNLQKWMQNAIAYAQLSK